MGSFYQASAILLLTSVGTEASHKTS